MKTPPLITTSLSPCLTKDYFDNTLKIMFAQSDEIFKKKHEEMNQTREGKHEESKKIGNKLVNTKS